MFRAIISLLFFAITTLFSSDQIYSNAKTTPYEEPLLLVSLLPYKELISSIAGPDFRVEVLLPVGADPHSFEPTFEQLDKLQKGTFWFCMKEGWERRLIRKAPLDCKVVNLLDNIPLLGGSCAEHADHHVWLDPTLVQKQLSIVVTALSQAYPEKESLFVANFQKISDHLTSIDREVIKALAPIEPKVFIVSHSAFQYFAKRYGWQQIALEEEGKELSIAQFQQMMMQSKQLQIKKVFVQEQHSQKAAHALAEFVGAKLVVIDPYQGDLFSLYQQLIIELSSSVDSSSKDKCGN